MEGQIYYAHYDPDTFEVLGYYTPAVHTEIPVPNYLLDYDTWYNGVTSRANRIDLTTGTLYTEVPEPTTEERIEAIRMHVQNTLDAQAITMGYDNIFTAVTYADEPAVPKFQQEGIALRAWRSSVWAYCYDQLDQWQLGQIPDPTPESIVAGLPAFAL